MEKIILEDWEKELYQFIHSLEGQSGRGVPTYWHLRENDTNKLVDFIRQLLEKEETPKKTTKKILIEISKDFIDSLITKAYEEGKKDKDSEPVEEIPQMKGTREALDKLTPSNH